MNINRKQFLGSLLSGVAIGCTPTFATEKLVKSEPTEFEKCRNDILYFVDNYLIVKEDNLWHGKNYQLILTDQQREYLKKMSETKDILVCAKGRQIGISTANNVFAYWKSIFFGPDHHVWIVSSNKRLCYEHRVKYMGISNSGFMPLPNRVHFVTFDRIGHDVDWNDCNNTYILDEYDWWKDKADASVAYEIIVRMNYSRNLEEGHSIDGFDMNYSPIIISGTPKYGDTSKFVFSMMKYFLHDSRYLVLPSPTTGLKG